MRSESLYIAASANRASFVADSGIINTTEEGLASVIAYASHKAVAIWSQPQSGKHSGASYLIPTNFASEITTLQAAHSSQAAELADGQAASTQRLAFLIAGSRSGELALLRADASGAWFRSAWPQEAHSATITTISIIEDEVRRGHFSVVTGSADGTAKIWRVNGTAQSSDSVSISLRQTLSASDLKGALPLCAQLQQLPISHSTQPQPFLLALALTKSYIQLWTLDPSAPSTSDAPAFHLSLQLTGHEDWVRALSFAKVSDSELILASGGQDNYIRLWRITQHKSEAPSPVSNASLPTASGAEKGKGKDDDDYISKLMRKIELGEEQGEDGASGLPADGALPSNIALSANSRAFTVGTGANRQIWVVTMDALLVGHDGWITGLRWHPSLATAYAGKISVIQPAALLSTSADNSAIVWAPAATSPDRYVHLASEQASTSIWAPQQRFGELGGGTSLGFYGAVWTPPSPITFNPGSELGQDLAVVSPYGIFCHAYNGATRLWAPDSSEGSSETSAAVRRWGPRNAITGHLGPCKSISWDPTGCMLLSSGSTGSTSSSPSHTWHEIARPQTHGYDLNSVTWIDQWNFASAADEKVVRVFTAPANFVETVNASGGLDGLVGGQIASSHSATSTSAPAPIGASVPPLGLSNRAIFDEEALANGVDTFGDSKNESGQPIGSAKTSVAEVFRAPPNEDELHVSTLWPELDKLYGHGYELFALGAGQPKPSNAEDADDGSNSGRYVASSCKANNEEHAVIRIHDRQRKWKEVAQLPGHKLSITRIRFFPGDARGRKPNSLILSSGRDRSWHLHGLLDDQAVASNEGNNSRPLLPWRLVEAQQAHTRIVWDCAWSLTGSYFATASRDKTVKVWALGGDYEATRSHSVDLLATLKMDSACTSVSFGPRDTLAVGTERGDIAIFTLGAECGAPDAADDMGSKMTLKWTSALTMPGAHSEAVRELAFRPAADASAETLFLASAGDDGCVRISALKDL
ncbi:Elongator subunit elp2 [Tilletia horrida]|nr:Elongator subunit elp2 [Tilletia horrida]